MACPDLVSGRLELVLARLAASVAVSGGAEGADTLFAQAALDVGCPLALVLPNRWYRSWYPRAVPDSVVGAASSVSFAVVRPDVEDWRARWSSERWWRDSFVRNQAMVEMSDVAVVVSARPPSALLAESRGGTSACVRELRRRRGEAHRVVWVPDRSDRAVVWTYLRTCRADRPR